MRRGSPSSGSRELTEQSVHLPRRRAVHQVEHGVPRVLAVEQHGVDLQRPGSEAPWGCRVWNLLTGEARFTDSPTSAFTQQLGGEPPWEKLKPFPRRIRRLLRRMLRKEFSQRPARVMELQREIEQCLAVVERREALAARIALPLNIGRQWLIGAPWPLRAAIFGASAMGVVLALGYYWNSDPPPQSEPAMETSGIV